MGLAQLSAHLPPFVSSFALPTHFGPLIGVPVLTFLLLRFLKRHVRRYLMARFTGMYDLRKLGTARPKDKRIKGTVVVCGGSIAGLWAARVCLDHFEDVVIVESESWLGTEQGVRPIFGEDGGQERHGRSRVIQYDSGHTYQVFLLLALRQAFPNADKELKRFGAKIELAEYNLRRSGVSLETPTYDYPDGKYPECIFMTRESFELALRNLVTKHSSRLRWVTGTVTGLKAHEGDINKVQAAIVRDENSGHEHKLEVDLIIDCTGGSCAGFKWLKRWNRGSSSSTAPALKPEQEPAPLDADTTQWEDLREVYHPHLRSVTFRYVVPPSLRDSLPLPGGYDNTCWLYTFIPDPELENRLVFGSRIEGNRIELVCTAFGELGLPTKPGQLRSYIEGLKTKEPIPEWLLDTAEILSEFEEITVAECAIPACHWIHYENAPRIPSNFIALGDAVMRVNPVFAQGVTKACLGAVTLDGFLRSQTEISANLSKKFFKLHTDRIASLWTNTKPADYAYSTTTPVKGESLESGKLIRSLAEIIINLCFKDRYISSTLWHIRMFLAPHTDMFHPYILYNISLEALKGRLGWA